MRQLTRDPLCGQPETCPLLRGGTCHNCERVYSSRTGALVDMLVSSSLIEYGGKTAILSVKRDISERKHAEQALRESELKYRGLFENANDAILIFEPQSETILEANNKACELYGFPKDELVGMSLKTLTKNIARAERQLSRVLQAGACHNFETVHLNSKGTPIDVSVSSSVIEYDGRTAVLSINRDITERKRAERAMRQLSGRLLRVQDEERRNLARELHDGTAQNLSLLKMNLSLVSESMNEPEAAKTLADSMAVVDQCLKEVRTVSYLLHPPLLDELGLADAVHSYTDGFTERTGIAVRLDLPPKMLRLPSEIEMSMFRIVQECLSNIHRHSGSKSARIRIRLAPTEIVLEVRDRGRGIPPKMLSRAQGNATKLGVGITGMRERARQLGGRLEIKSTSHSTTVKAVLPLSGADG